MKRSALLAIAVLAAGCGSHPTTEARSNDQATASPATTASSRSAVIYGARPDALAAKLGLSRAHPDASQSPDDPQFPVVGTLIGTLGDKTVVVCTFANPADEQIAAGTVQAGGAYLPPGEHWYAGAAGWFGYSTDFDKATAELIAGKLGGSIKQIS